MELISPAEVASRVGETMAWLKRLETQRAVEEIEAGEFDPEVERVLFGSNGALAMVIDSGYTCNGYNIVGDPLGVGVMADRLKREFGREGAGVVVRALYQNRAKYDKSQRG